jgi:SAM-dependent methyltransferase
MSQPFLSHGHGATPERLAGAGDNARLQELRAGLEGFELGRFLLANQGLNGAWTSWLLRHPERQGRDAGLSSDGTALTDLEAWLLERCPIILATQERFQIFQQLTQPLLRPGARLASIPCGLLDDLLSLDTSGIDGITITAVDLDPASLTQARTNQRQRQPSACVSYEQRDAWTLDSPGRWDLITSNGLNIYVEDDAHCIALYRSLAASLRPGGQLLISFITPPAEWRPHDAADLEMQRLIFSAVLQPRWQCLRSESLTRAQLAAAGLEPIQVVYDSQRMFPAVQATKRP